MNWQYLVIGILFIIALFYLWKKVVVPFNVKKDSCGDGCGCSVNLDELEKKKKKL